VGGNAEIVSQATDSKRSLTPASARQVLVAACEAVGLDPHDAELVRIGSNAVYRLQDPTIVRIAQDQDSIDNATLQVDVARWLAGQGYPATRALDVRQPVAVEGRVATFWVSAAEREEYAPIEQVARLIRELHDLPAPIAFKLPPAQPFARGESYLQRLGGLPAAEAEFLTSRLHELRGSYERLTFALPPGPIHGDANVGNVILDRDGAPLLIDLDSFATGPREWDLVETALFYERFGWHTEEEYRTFVGVYGFDVMTWEGYPVLADAREVMMTAWLGRMAGESEKAAVEVHKRIESMRYGGSRRDWAPF
jgi:Ser/Thr protein kinase RdoA (MazF antagonist)